MLTIQIDLRLNYEGKRIDSLSDNDTATTLLCNVLSRLNFGEHELNFNLDGDKFTLRLAELLDIQHTSKPDILDEITKSEVGLKRSNPNKKG